MLQWCFFEMECTQNSGGLLFRICEYVICFCWAFTEQVENRIFGHNWLYESLGHLLNFRGTFSNSAPENVSVFYASEIYLQRVKHFLSTNWIVLIAGGTLADLQKLIPFHANWYKQIILNSTTPSSCIAPHDLSFANSFIVAVLFLMVKATRPITYKHLTVVMIKSIGEKRYHKPNVIQNEWKIWFQLTFIFLCADISYWLYELYTNSFKSSL